jgi:high affinity Mn2+ porin
LAKLKFILGTYGSRELIRRAIVQNMLRFVCLILVSIATPYIAFAQSSTTETSDATVAEPSAADQPSDHTPLTLFPHSDTSRYWISGQANVIFQWHPTFFAKYSGPNSLSPGSQSATTHILTLYTGYELTHTTEILADVEDATGGGVGSALGVAGFTDLDAVRTVQGVPLSTDPYLARFIVRQIIPLSDERIAAERGPLGLATSLPARRIEFRVGKFSLVDFFDANSGGSDSHLQFLNWAVDNNGAYDYAANTRGYTDAAMLEYDDHSWSVRFAEAMMPKVANGIHLDADLARARAENLEGEWRRNFLPGRAGVVRVLTYLNHANMGNYREAIDEFLDGQTSIRPSIIGTRREGRHKYGLGLNFEQDLASQFGIFLRLGWSDGHNESFAYTEVDRTAEGGAYLKGAAWHRRYDRTGAVFTINGISGDHARYLALGGLGFILGDGALSYGGEKIFETYYTAHLWRGIFASFDLQHINDPGYNEARGPVLVPALRAHIDF